MRGLLRHIIAPALVLLLFQTSFAIQPTNSVPVAKAALVIGNADYEAANILKNPTTDAQDMCRALNQLGFATSCYLNMRTRVQMRAAIQDFADTLTPGTVSFIYYAGHAVQINGENYLIPTAAQLQSESSVTGESVGLSYVMTQLRQSHAYLNIVVLDACRENPLPPSSRSLAQGLAQVTDIPDSTVVFFATAANSLALDGVGRNGILTKNLLAHLREEGSVNDLFDSVSSGVQRDANQLGRVQQPALYKNFGGQYCLLRCTELEQQDAKVKALEVRVASGEQVQAELDIANKKFAKMEDDQRRKDEAARKEADKKARNRQDDAFVPPNF
jgi:hypothetical protein